ncbi:MAG: hypothetical protein PHG61_10140 [Candidatus Marinimicrobia bacterium]|nr:hypothetical protein [Candidatus Neomarinimicrobiota bacterium]
MSNVSKDQIFIDYLMSILGRHIDVITGRNGYSVSKEKHAEMLKSDGMYVFLEKTPEEISHTRPFDKAFILPARVADAHFATNDPEKIKSSFSLAADKLRFKFYSQMHRIYEFNYPSLNIRLFPMGATRKNVRIYREEWEHLYRKDGVYMFICTNPAGQLIDVVTKPAHVITFAEKNKSREIPIDLSGEGAARLNRYIQSQTEPEPAPVTTCNKCQSVGGGDCNECNLNTPAHATAAQSKIEEYLSLYLTNGLPVILTFPEGKESLQITCVITGTQKIPRTKEMNQQRSAEPGSIPAGAGE